jgi:hypothetical protein
MTRSAVAAAAQAALVPRCASVAAQPVQAHAPDPGGTPVTVGETSKGQRAREGVVDGLGAGRFMSCLAQAEKLCRNSGS